MERHVDLWTKRSAVHSIHSPGTTKAPVPSGDEGLRGRGGGQRQRMDITRPTTIAPKPIAKFQAPSDTISGILSPAT